MALLDLATESESPMTKRKQRKSALFFATSSHLFLPNQPHTLLTQEASVDTMLCFAKSSADGLYIDR